MCVTSTARDVITGLQLRTTWQLPAARGGLSAFRQAAKSQVAPTLQSRSIFGQLIFSLFFQSPNVRERTGSALDVRDQRGRSANLSHFLRLPSRRETLQVLKPETERTSWTPCGPSCLLSRPSNKWSNNVEVTTSKKLAHVKRHPTPSRYFQGFLPRNSTFLT